MKEVDIFIDNIKNSLLPDLKKINRFDKARLGTFFSVRNPKNAMRSFVIFLSKIDWSSSMYLKELLSPFAYLGKDKPVRPTSV